MPRLLIDDRERFWRRVDRPSDSDCWLWLGAVGTSGYGRFKIEGRTGYAHRVALEFSGLTIPTGMQVDHLCERKTCVNPAHLDIVTPLENVRRSLV